MKPWARTFFVTTMVDTSSGMKRRRASMGEMPEAIIIAVSSKDFNSLIEDSGTSSGTSDAFHLRVGDMVVDGDRCPLSPLYCVIRMN